MSSDAESIVGLLRDHGPLPVARISEMRTASRSKTGQAVERLVRSEVLVRGGRAESRGGRPSSIVELSGDLRFIGVDIGPTSISVAMTDGYLNILESLEEDTDLRNGPGTVLAQVESLARSISGHGRGPLPVAGVGLGMPGPVDVRAGTPVAPPLMPGWDGFGVRDRASEALGVPVSVDRDVNLMALGERHSGAARGAADYLFVKLGTGISCGVMLSGSVHRGHSGGAGDIGHIQVGSSKELCHCGRTGCLEAQFGAEALARRAKAAAQSAESPMLAQRLAQKGTLDASDIGWASAAGDPASSRLIRECGQLTGRVLADIVTFANPELIVVGGPLTHLGPMLTAEIHSTILSFSTAVATTGLTVTSSMLYKSAGVIGGARLASETLIRSLGN